MSLTTELGKRSVEIVTIGKKLLFNWAIVLDGTLRDC